MLICSYSVLCLEPSPSLFYAFADKGHIHGPRCAAETRELYSCSGATTYAHKLSKPDIAPYGLLQRVCCA